MTRIAVMQPYFIPYAGYFRLMANVDAFVVSDCLQFPGKGFVHRNRLIRKDGKLDWFTLPVTRSPFDQTIAELKFSPDAAAYLTAQRNRFELFDRRSERIENLIARLDKVDRPLTLIFDLMQLSAGLLGFTPHFIMLSDLGLPGAPKGAEIIYAACAKLGADRYINAPGGALLYDAGEFRKRGIALEFLPAYVGSYVSILQRLADEPAAEVRAEIDANL
jgi:hypothetical protein